MFFSFRDFETFPDRHPGYDASFEGIRKSLHDLEAMEEDSLRQAAMDLVNAYEGIVDDDYATIYQLMHDSIYTQSDSIQGGQPVGRNVCQMADLQREVCQHPEALRKKERYLLDK